MALVINFLRRCRIHAIRTSDSRLINSATATRGRDRAPGTELVSLRWPREYQFWQFIVLGEIYRVINYSPYSIASCASPSSQIVHSLPLSFVLAFWCKFVNFFRITRQFQFLPQNFKIFFVEKSHWGLFEMMLYPFAPELHFCQLQGTRCRILPSFAKDGGLFQTLITVSFVCQCQLATENGMFFQFSLL